MIDCAQFEVLLADYVDGTLPESEKARVEKHAADCEHCRELLADVQGAVRFLAHSEEVVPPPDLITRIAYHAPTGRIRQPFERQGFMSRLISEWLRPILQPRLAMGMAMTILSIAMLERCTGVKMQHIQPEDLSPVRIWGGIEDKTVRVKDRAVKYYENLRWVYEIEVRLRELREQQDTAPAQDTQPLPKKPGPATTSPDNSKTEGADAK
ncbi:MAG: anti-sigma factor family protein [Bryobacteraceae bacterium]